MTDPTGRTPGSWPRDRPVRWRALGRNVSTLVVTTLAFIVQFGLVVGVLALPSDAAGGWLRPLVALAWGIGVLWTAWCWVTWRARGIVAPVLTAALIWLAAAAS